MTFQQALVLNAITAAGEGITSRQVAERTGLLTHVARARCSELRQLGRTTVLRTNEGEGAYGQPQYVYGPAANV